MNKKYKVTAITLSFISLLGVTSLTSCEKKYCPRPQTTTSIVAEETQQFTDSEITIKEELYNGKFKLTTKRGQAEGRLSSAAGDVMYGLLDKNNKTLFECVYTDIFFLNENRIYAWKMSEGGAIGCWIIDSTGKMVSDKEYLMINFKFNEKTKEYLQVGIADQLNEENHVDGYFVDFSGNKLSDIKIENFKFNDDLKTITVREKKDDETIEYVVDMNLNKTNDKVNWD